MSTFIALLLSVIFGPPFVNLDPQIYFLFCDYKSISLQIPLGTFFAIICFADTTTLRYKIFFFVCLYYITVIKNSMHNWIISLGSPGWWELYNQSSFRNTNCPPRKKIHVGCQSMYRFKVFILPLADKIGMKYLRIYHSWQDWYNLSVTTMTMLHYQLCH